MNNNDHIFAEPPRELAAALGWRLNPSPEEVEEAASMDLFSRNTAVSNPWLARPGEGGVIEFGDDDAQEEREFAAAIEPVAKLFAPKVTGNNVPSFNRPLPIQDEDEQQYFRALAPLEKLFHPDAITTVTQPEVAKFTFTKRATVPAPEAPPLEKSGTGLDTFSEELEAGLQQALDQAIEDCLPSSEDESTFDFFRRVDARLQALGFPTILTAPNWTTAAY